MDVGSTGSSRGVGASYSLCQRRKTDSHFLFGFFTDPPSLQRIALTSISVGLWTSMTNVKQLFLQVQHFSEWYKQIEQVRILKDSLLEKLEEINLPHILKFELSKFIMPVGLQLLKWFTHSFEEYCHPYDISRAGGVIYWTVEGTIDKVRSLKELIVYKDKDFYYLFKLACRYCVEDCILDLWIKISADERKATYNGYDDHIVAYWSAALENELDSLLIKIMPDDNYNIYDSDLSINENMVSLSIVVGNAFSLKYFWHKLTKVQKTNGLEKWLIKIFYSCYCEPYYDGFFRDMFCFLLTQLDDQNQQQSVFEMYSSSILIFLIPVWPHQRFFLPTICAMFDFLNEDVYVHVMLMASATERKKNEEKLFSGVWRSSPVRFKNAFLQYLTISAKEISLYLGMGDVEVANMMLDDASTERKKQIIFRMTKCTEFYELAYSSRSALIITLVSKILSNSDINSIKLRVLLDSVKMLDHLGLQNKIQANEEFLKWTFQLLYEAKDFEKASVNPTHCYTLLVLTGNYDLVNEFLSWYFIAEEEIKQFKSSFIYENYSNCKFLLALISRLDKNGWNVFEKFVSFCLCSSEEMDRFIELYRNRVKDSLGNHNLKFATSFMNWCFSSSDDVHIFKNDLIISRGVISLLVCIRESPDKVKEIIEWFCPLSKSTTSQLKVLIQNELKRQIGYGQEEARVALFYLLDRITGEDVTKYEEPSWRQLMNNVKSFCGEKAIGNISEDVSGVVDVPLVALSTGPQFRTGDSVLPSNLTLEQSREAILWRFQDDMKYLKNRDRPYIHFH